MGRDAHERTANDSRRSDRPRLRSSFRQWAAEQTSFPEAVCELALAHVNRDRVEAAYQRSDLFERRRVLMETWCRYLSANDNVSLIRSEA